MHVHAVLVSMLTVWCTVAPAVAGDLAEGIRSESARIEPSLIEARRWFHQHPELSNRERATAAEIARRLRGMGLEVRTGIAGTGVVAMLRGASPGAVVAWRADIDALPIQEKLDLPYRSTTNGVMHACGHDVHITVGLGVAEVLTRLRNQLHGTVVLIFQPAEEGPPEGERGGAPLMIEEGVLDGPAPQAIFGLHVMPTLPAGTVGLRAGGMLAAADRFVVTVHGRMSHGSAPQEGVDAVVVAAHLVTALQEIASREIDPRRPVVVSVGSLHAGNRFNIIADTATLEGTIRTLDEDTHTRVHEAMRRIVAGVCQGLRATCDVTIDVATPVTVNDAGLAAFARTTLVPVLGEGHVVEAEPIMAAEDFAFYARRIPGLYLFLGVATPGAGAASYLHTPTFQPDESAILVGVRTAASLLAAYTESHAGAPSP